MSKDLICPKCNTEYWGLATGKNGAKCSNCSYEFAVADVKAVLLPNEDLTCILCKEEEVEVEDGEKTSSYCNSCFFHVLILRNGKNYLETMKPYLYGTSELIGMNKEYIEED